MDRIKNSFICFLTGTVILSLVFLSCKQEWYPGIPLEKEKIRIGVIHITDPFNESSGYSFAHQSGIEEMKQSVGLKDSQILYKTNVEDQDTMQIEGRIRELIAQGANIIIATSWGYMDICEKLAVEHPLVVFAHATGYKYNETNFTNFFGKVYQARYLSGIVAGMQTKTNNIGYVAAWGTDNSEVTGGINAFALGVEKVNPQAKIFVKVTHSWFDPMGEAAAARALIAAGCDVIAQHCDSATPLIEAERAGVWGIGYNTDMSIEAPAAVLTSVLWHWSAYYTVLVNSVIDGTFSTSPWFGSLNDGIIDLAPLNKNIDFSVPLNETGSFYLLDEERRRIETGEFFVFSGVMKTNDGGSIGREGEVFSDEEIRGSINWYYRNVTVIR